MFHTPAPHDLRLTASSWKDKIYFCSQVDQRLANPLVSLEHENLDALWPTLLRDPNLNVVTKALRTLRTYALRFGLKKGASLRETVRLLVGLTRVRREEIDRDVATILGVVLAQEEQSGGSFGVFSSSNHPTFLTGALAEGEEAEPESPQRSELGELLFSHLQLLRSRISDGCQLIPLQTIQKPSL